MNTKLLSVAMLALVSVGSGAHAMDRKGPPKKVRCTALALRTKKPILEKTDINELLRDTLSAKLGDSQFECVKYPGDRGETCAAMLESGKFQVYYAFNTQSGNLEIEDKVTGQSSWQSWLNEYDLTGTGHLGLTTWLTNTRGGLLGDPRVFRIEVSCHGTEW